MESRTHSRESRRAPPQARLAAANTSPGGESPEIDNQSDTSMIMMETVDPPDLSLSGSIPLLADDNGMGTTSTFIFEAIPTIAPAGETDLDDLDFSIDWSDTSDLEDMQHAREEDAAEETFSETVWKVVLISGIVWGGLVACVTCLYRLMQGRGMEMILGIMLGIGWGGLIIFSTGFMLVGFIVGVVITALAVGIGSQQKVC